MRNYSYDISNYKMEKIIKHYDICRYSNGNEMYRNEGYESGRFFIIWHGIGIWNHYDGFMVNIRTNKDNILNGVRVELKYYDDYED